MHVNEKIHQLVQRVIFKHMISINKIQIHSGLLAVIFLCLKSILGIWMILTIIISQQSIVISIFMPVRNYFQLSSGELLTTDIIITVVFTILNALSLIMYFNPLGSLISFDFSKLHLALMLFLQSVQYMFILMMCANIYNYILVQAYILVILQSLNLIVLIGSLLLFKAFYFTISHGVKNILGRFPSAHNAMIEAATMGMIAIVSFIGQAGITMTAKIIINIMLMFLKLLIISNLLFNYILDYSMRKWYYINSLSQNLFAFLQITQTLALLFNLILQISEQTLLAQNFYVSVFITASFCFLGWRNFFIHQQQALFFYKGKDIKEIPKAVLYFKALYDLSGLGENNSDDSHVILSSIRKQHQIKCNNKNCYCQSQGTYEDDCNFAKMYIIQQLDDLRTHFKNQPKILIQELNFRFRMYKTYPQVLTRLFKIRTHFTLGVIQNFSIQSLKADLIKYMADRNRTASTIDVQTPLDLQQTTADIEKIIQKDIEKKNNKWMYLSKGLCRTEELEEDIRAEIGFIKEITQIQNVWNKKMKRSMLFNYLLLFYYKKVSFLNVNVNQIYKNLNEAMKKIKEEELSTVKQFAKCLFHKRSCVIQSPINEDNMGIVTRASKNVYDLFGYQPSKIIGINLNRLMPNFMAIQHDIILAEWVRDGTWRTVGKLKEIFCIHKQQYCFNALLYLKIIANSKGLFFMTVVFKKNESDYLILNDKKEIEGIGRKFLHVIGSNCRRMPIEVLFNNFPENEIPKNFQYKQFTRVFRSFRNNEQLVDEFFQQKSLLFQKDISLDQLIRTYRQKLRTSLNFERWQVKFDAKLYKMREVRYYVILMNTARLLEGQDSRSMNTYNQGKFENILVGHGKMNEDEDSSFDNSKNSSRSTAGRNQARFIDDQGSSVASYGGRQSFTLNKLLSVFFNYFIDPKNIKDKRIDILNISTLIQTLILVGIITFSFVAYTGNMNDIGQYMTADGDVNQNMQRIMLLYNRVISFQQYHQDRRKLNWIMIDSMSDMNEFYSSTRWQLSNLQSIKSSYSRQQLYAYLNSEMSWQFTSNSQTFTVEALMFFQFYYYVTGSIALDVYEDVTINLVQDRMYEMGMERFNFPQYQAKLQEFPNNFLLLVQQSVAKCTLISLLLTAAFIIITFIFFLYNCNYHRFRNQQKYQTIHIYQIIPVQLIQSLKSYYFQLFNFVNRSHNRSTGIEVNPQNFSQNYLNIQQKLYNMGNTHIKFLGRRSFYGWIKPMIIFLTSNVIYIVITYEVIRFLSPLNQLMVDVNQIMDSENKLYESYLQLKSSYLLSPQPSFSNQTFKNIIEIVGQNEVSFDKATTFNSDILITYDPNFYDDFKNILITNVCDQVKDQVTDTRYAYCNAWTNSSMISQGVITFMNHLQRILCSAVIDLQANLTQRFQTQGEKYFINRGFEDIDFVMTYNIKVFKKLIDRIVEAYQKGVDYITLVNYIIVMLLITPQVVGIVFWFQLTLSQKNKISFLFGSILTIPPQLIRQVKNLPILTKKILEFTQT